MGIYKSWVLPFRVECHNPATFFWNVFATKMGFLKKIFLTLTRTLNRTAICLPLTLKLLSLFINHCSTQKSWSFLFAFQDILTHWGCVWSVLDASLFQHRKWCSATKHLWIFWHCLIRTRFLAFYTKLPKSLLYFLLAEQILAHASTLVTSQVPGFRDFSSSGLAVCVHELGRDLVEKREHQIWYWIGRGESYFWDRSFCTSLEKQE